MGRGGTELATGAPQQTLIPGQVASSACFPHFSLSPQAELAAWRFDFCIRTGALRGLFYLYISAPAGIQLVSLKIPWGVR